MKIIKKIKRKLNLTNVLISKGKFKPYDLIHFLKPRSSWWNKQLEEELCLSFDNNFLSKDGTEDLLFSIGKNEFVILPEMKFGATIEVLDFGKSLYERRYDNDCWYYESEGPYEIENCQIKEGDYIIDAGANLGLFSVLVGNIIGSNGKVFAFEPVSKTREVLENNIKQNNISNCEIVAFALGNSNKDVEIFIDDNHLGASSIVIKDKSKKRKELIKQIKLDDFVEQNQISKIDFIKADIEGAERDMLKGAEKAIKKFKPRIAICTYHLPDDPEVLEGILKEFVPEYNIVHRYKKMYAWV